jgi:putative transposase
MPRTRRSSLDAPFFHVLNRSVRKAPIFRRPPDYRAFLGVLQEGLDRFPVRLVAFCLLSNHWHLVVEPAGISGLIRFMHWVTTTHAARWHKHRDSRGQGPLYQGRYKSVPITGMGELIQVCRYVERNALTAGLVRRAQDWPWCSLAERLRAAPEVTLKTARFLTSQAWIDHVNAEWSTRERIDEPDGLRDVAEVPGGRPQRGKQRRRGRGRRHEHKSHAHVERPEHLPVRHAARRLQPPEQRRNRPALPVK